MVSESIQSTLNWIAANPGWMGLVVFLTSLAESLAIVGLFVPGAMLMFGFGALIGLGHLPFWPVFGWAVAGAVVGDGLSFWLGRTFHERLPHVWPFSRYPAMLARSEDFFRRHGGKSVLFGRFFGPVRAVVPAVAGMLDMPTARFLLVNVVSALLWAPAYLLPGAVFAASLELASQVAWRLALVILLLVALIWFTIRVVRGLFRILQPRINGWLRGFLRWSRDYPVLGYISASLIDPEQSEFRGIVSLVTLLLGTGIFTILLFNATGHELPTIFDQNVYRIAQDLRTPWTDNVMVPITRIGDWLAAAAVSVTVLAWLIWKRAHLAAWHWLAALGLGATTNLIFQWLARVPQPENAQAGLAPGSFPSNNATLSTILFGFIAVLIAREIDPPRRWIPYLGAALLIVPIAFSELYLGLHWLSDIVAGLCLGLVWVTLLGLGYGRHRATDIPWSGLLAVSMGTLVVVTIFVSAIDGGKDQYRYQPQSEVRRMDIAAWRDGDWRQLPAFRLDLRGKQQQALDLQWATTGAELQHRLTATGWIPAPPLTAAAFLNWLSPKTTIDDLPVLPRVHDGRHEQFAFTRPGGLPDTRWVLRFWDAGLNMQPGDLPLWLASLTLQHLERRFDFLSLPVEIADSDLPSDLLNAAWAGLRVRTVSAPHNTAAVTLVSE